MLPGDSRLSGGDSQAPDRSSPRPNRFSKYSGQEPFGCWRSGRYPIRIADLTHELTINHCLGGLSLRWPWLDRHG
jgi:hypothetical protein